MARAPALAEIEEYPEADQLDGFPHPRETAKLFGHADAERALADALAGDRMHHGWIIGGLNGIGKATLAYRFARCALAKSAERHAGSLDIADDSSAARQVRALSHPGLLVIRRPYLVKDKRIAATIPVEEVRRLRTFLSHAAEVESWRIVIVDSADELNVNAANALLKSLEEPPPRTVFLLVSSEPGRLLPTIRSRCRTLDLAPLQAADLKAAATQAWQAAEANGGAENWNELEKLAQGSVRRLLSLNAQGGAALWQRIWRLVSGLPQVDWNEIHALSDELAASAATQRFELFYGLLFELIARLVRAAATGQGHAEEVALAQRLMAEGRLASFAELWENLVREKADALALNLDRKTLILETVARLAAAARR